MPGSLPHRMAHFDMVIVGCGGGPSEKNLSRFVPLTYLNPLHAHFALISYFLKARNERWADGILALEAGEIYIGFRATETDCCDD